MASQDGAATPLLCCLTVGDEPDTWRSAGFTVDSAGSCRIGQVEVTLMGSTAEPGINAWGFTGDLPDRLDGLETMRIASPPADDAPHHENGSVIIDHVVVLTPHTARTVAAFEDVGLAALRTRATDTNGHPMVQTFFRSGEVIIELVGPEEPSGGDSASFFGLAHTVSDLEATAALLDDGLGDIKDAVQDARRIATLRHKQFGMSVPTAFMTSGP